MSRKLVAIGVTVFALLGLASASLPAMATGPNWFYNSEGCDGYGYTWLSGTNQISSETDAEVIGSSSPCTWEYLNGSYQSTGGNWYFLGPGWDNNGTGYYKVVVSNAQHAANVGHSGCNPGGPCTNANFSYTSY